MVLDAWAIVGWLRGESSATAAVRSLLEKANAGELRLSMNIVNLGEVFYTTIRQQGRTAALDAIYTLRSFLNLVVADETLTLRAAGLKANGGLSYADCFAAATALELDTELVTGDRELRRLAERMPELKLRWIGA